MKRQFSLVLAAWIAVLLGVSLLLAQANPQRPYVVLVSLDGFRYDYAEKYHAKNILAVGKAGATAEAMIPSFPSVTFPNHISIVTGQYPEHHGIVSNTFWDPTLKQQYGIKQSATEGASYHYKPLWVVAEQQGVKAASMFWPTADAPIEGVRPSYWSLYDGRFPNEKRVEKVLEWLKLPEGQRPHFITLYFSDVDTAGHSFGPDSAETAQAVERVDNLIGTLWAGLQASTLPVNLVVVSDHGMQTVSGRVTLSDYTDMSKVRVLTDGPIGLLYSPDAATTDKVYAGLKGKSKKFDVYRTAETPERWHFSQGERIGDLVVYVRDAATLGVDPAPERQGAMRPGSRGSHGFDPYEYKTMDAIFYAAGPNVQPGSTVKPFENVNVFPFIAKILALQSPPGIDGTEAPLASVYRK
jgi:predicted AlkP superfamily pyrophosphatase or phosphodiesterase